jgi:hypothetical protein
MTDKQINTAIARECGWTEIRDNIVGKAPGETANRVMFLPNYSTSLNAMHEAEKVLRNGRNYEYLHQLERVAPSNMAYATARQRAEAFLRTLRKWEEGE